MEGGDTEAEAVFFISFHQPPPAWYLLFPLLFLLPTNPPLSLAHMYANKARHANETCRWGSGGEGKGQREVGEDRKKSQGNGRTEKERKGEVMQAVCHLQVPNRAEHKHV